MFAPEHADDAPELTQAFMEKTFDVTFDLPAPVTSDWQEYLARMAKIAFGQGLRTTDVYWIATYLDEKHRTERLLVTPRVVNTFVNGILSQYLQRPSPEISIPVVAYYHAFLRDAEDLVSLLREPRRPLPPARDWRTDVVALRYGVERRKALQVFLQTPIRDAVKEGDSAQFEELAGVPGFGAEFERLLREPMPGAAATEFSFVTNAGILLDGLGSDEPWVTQCWRRIISRYLLTNAPEELPSDFASRVQVLARHIATPNRQEFVSVTANHLAMLMSRIPVVSDAMRQAVGACEGLITLAEEWSVNRPEFHLERDPKDSVSLIALCSSSPTCKQLRLAAPAAEVVSELTRRLSDPLSSAAVVPVIRALQAFGTELLDANGDVDLTPLVNPAADRLRTVSGSDTTAGAAANVLGVLRQSVEPASVQITNLTSEGIFLTRANEAATAKNEDLLAACYTFLLERRVNFGPPPGQNWANLFKLLPDVPKEVSDRIGDFYGNSEFLSLWDWLQSSPAAKGLITAVIGVTLSLGRLDGGFPAEAVQKLRDFLLPLDQDQQRRLVAAVCRSDDIWTLLESAPLDDNFSRLAKHLRRRSAEDGIRITRLIQQRLRTTSDAQWAGAVETVGPLARIAIGFGEADFGKKSNLYAGLANARGAVLATSDKRVIGRWFELSKLLSSSARKSALSALGADMAQGGYVGNLLALVKEDGGDVLHHMGPDEIVGSVLLPLLPSDPGRRWILANAELLKPILSHASRDRIGELKVEIDRVGRSKAESRREAAPKLRKALGV